LKTYAKFVSVAVDTFTKKSIRENGCFYIKVNKLYYLADITFLLLLPLSVVNFTI
jgi:hypothetical protein